MQDNIETIDPGASGDIPSAKEFNASDFTALNSQSQMLFVASTLVGVGDDVSTLKTDVSTVKTDVSTLKTDVSTKSESTI